MDKAASAAQMAAMIADFLRRSGFDPDLAKREIAALASKLICSGEDPTRVPYDRILEMARELPSFHPSELGGAYLVIGTVNHEGKHCCGTNPPQ